MEHSFKLKKPFSFYKHRKYFSISYQLLRPSGGVSANDRRYKVELQERADRPISSLYIPNPPPESPPLLDERSLLPTASLASKKEYFDFLSDSR
jgi:hypothetical protein